MLKIYTCLFSKNLVVFLQEPGCFLQESVLVVFSKNLVVFSPRICTGFSPRIWLKTDY